MGGVEKLYTKMLQSMSGGNMKHNWLQRAIFSIKVTKLLISANLSIRAAVLSVNFLSASLKQFNASFKNTYLHTDIT